LHGYKLDSVETGRSYTRINGKSIDPERAIIVHYVIFKKEMDNSHNYIKVRTVDLSEFSGREYLEAELSDLNNYYPSSIIDDSVRDTVINSNKGYFYSIIINYNNQRIKQCRYNLKSKSNKNYDITTNIVVNRDFNSTKNDFDNIVSEMTLK